MKRIKLREEKGALIGELMVLNYSLEKSVASLKSEVARAEWVIKRLHEAVEKVRHTE